MYPLAGRPPKQTAANARQHEVARYQARQDEIERNAVEGKFGQVKRRYSLNRIMTKLAGTSEMAIMLAFVVMNLKRWLVVIFFSFFKERECFWRSGYFTSQRHIYPYTNWEKATRNRNAMNALLTEFTKTECAVREDSLSKPC